MERGQKMKKPAQSVQDSFLHNISKDKSSLTIYLLKGLKLSGRVKSFDKYSLVLETSTQEQLIFKHAISTIVSQKLEELRPSLTDGGYEKAKTARPVED
jgi:host factor-I protein